MRALLRSLCLITAAGILFAGPWSDDAHSQGITDYPPATPCGLSLIWQADGDSAGGYFGFSVDGGRDINSNGVADIVAGAMLVDRTYFYCDYPGTTPSYYRTGNPETNFGRSVQLIGDFDGDTRGGAVIGAPNHSGAGFDSNGAVLSWDLNLDFSWLGESSGDKLGYSVANVGDVNGDGYDDIIAGAPEADGTGALQMGYALLLSPRTSSLIRRFGGLEPLGLFGRAVAGAGDVDGDGEPDLIIGAPLATRHGSPFDKVGAAFVYSAEGTLIWRFEGAYDHGYFGNSVANAGDVNNDGRPDIIVGAWRADPNSMTDAGSAYVYSGLDGSLIHRVDGEGPNHNFGYSVRGLGDIDADGHDDFIVGAHRADLNLMTDVGAVYVYSGKLGNLLWVIVGAAGEDLFGVSVASAGDITLDGRPDFLVGAFGADPGGRQSAGSVYLFGCPCNCDCNGDPDCDGVADILDVVGVVNVAFRGVPGIMTGNCRYEDADVNCTGACDVLDVVGVVNVAFRGADKATEFCSPCQTQ